MSKVYIGFSYPKQFKIGAKAIAWWTDSPYSHVYIRFAYSQSKDAIFHAAHSMVHFRSVDNFLRENNSIKEYEIEMSDTCHEHFFDECMELAGENYSTLDLVNIFISDVAFWSTKRVIHFQNSKGYICSELVGSLIKDRLQLNITKPLFLLKPKDIDVALSSKYEVFSGSK